MAADRPADPVADRSRLADCAERLGLELAGEDLPESEAAGREGDEPGRLAAHGDVGAARLRLALTHRSWAFESGVGCTNERLELLGDAVLNLAVTEQLLRLLPDAAEGRLARLRAATVATTPLAEAARAVDLGGWIRLGHGERAQGGADKDSILADTLEAVVAAVHLDGGASAAGDLVDRLLGGRLRRLADAADHREPKSELQELAAARGLPAPRYRVARSGPDHAQHFSARVEVGAAAAGTGEGASKKEAEQAAATAALAALAGHPGGVGSEPDEAGGEARER